MDLTLDPSGLPVIDSTDTAEGLVTLVFKIMKISRNRQGFRVLDCSGVYQGEIIELAVAMKSDMQCGVEAGPDGAVLRSDQVHPGGIVLQRSGPESDGLVGALAEIYQVELAPSSLEPISPFTCFALEGDPSDERSPVTFDLAAMTEEAEQYAELFLTLLPADGLVVLGEKDVAYRGPLVRYLAHEPDTAR